MPSSSKLELARIVFECHYKSVLSGIESTQKFRDHIIATVSCGGIALTFAILDRIGACDTKWLVWLYLIPLLCWATNILLLICSAEYSRKTGCAMADIIGSGCLTQSGVSATKKYNLRTRWVNIINIVVLAIGIVSFSIMLIATISCSAVQNKVDSVATSSHSSNIPKNIVTIENSTVENSTILK